jgi:hypothetical protein
MHLLTVHSLIFFTFDRVCTRFVRAAIAKFAWSAVARPRLRVAAVVVAARVRAVDRASAEVVARAAAAPVAIAAAAAAAVVAAVREAGREAGRAAVTAAAAAKAEVGRASENRPRRRRPSGRRRGALALAPIRARDGMGGCICLCVSRAFP